MKHCPESTGSHDVCVLNIHSLSLARLHCQDSLQRDAQPAGPVVTYDPGGSTFGLSFSAASYTDSLSSRRLQNGWMNQGVMTPKCLDCLNSAGFHFRLSTEGNFLIPPPPSQPMLKEEGKQA